MRSRYALIFLAAMITLPACAFANLILNEVDYDQIGTDGTEFVELMDTGPLSVDLSLYTLEFVNGSGELPTSPPTRT